MMYASISIMITISIPLFITVECSTLFKNALKGFVWELGGKKKEKTSTEKVRAGKEEVYRIYFPLFENVNPLFWELKKGRS